MFMLLINESISLERSHGGLNYNLSIFRSLNFNQYFIENNSNYLGMLL